METENPIQRINDLYWSFTISRAIHVAAKLGIADHVEPEGTSISAISKSAKANKDRIYRLMRFLASYEIFEETEKGTFLQTPLSETLRSDSPSSVRDAAHMVTKSMWEAYGHLEYSIISGKDAYTDLYGKGVFEHLDDHLDESAQFNRAMHNYAELENPEIASSYDFSNANQVADIGGGHGGFIKDILGLNSHLKGILFDQPQVVEESTILETNPDLSLRLSKTGGSFFDSIPISADIYILKRILHDWSDDDCYKILATVKASMNSESKLLIIDAIVPEGNAPHFSKNIEAFLMSWGGQERDQAEFNSLLAQVGFKITNIIRTDTPLSIVEVMID